MSCNCKGPKSDLTLLNNIFEEISCVPENLITSALSGQIVNRQLNGKCVTFILNEENASGRVRITFPYPVRDLISGRHYPAGKQLNLRIPAMQFAAFIGE